MNVAEAMTAQELEDLLYATLPALGCHARDFSQRALIDVCRLVGSDPYDWSAYPDVLDRLLDGAGSEPVDPSGM